MTANAGTVYTSSYARTVNGEWRFVYYFLGEIKTIAWMPFPEPYGENKENAD